ncbi:MAG: zinc ribbon domain-containing protein, partial [Rubrivivax sp.]|nr:zinc ribbon domain-containing protein [Rubrivivax sp.]
MLGSRRRHAACPSRTFPARDVPQQEQGDARRATAAGCAARCPGARPVIVLICHHCQRPSTIDARFCSACGTELRRLECPTCRAANDPESRHCHACGTALPAAAEASGADGGTAARPAVPGATAGASPVNTEPALPAARAGQPPRSDDAAISRKRRAVKAPARKAGRPGTRGPKPPPQPLEDALALDLELRALPRPATDEPDGEGAQRIDFEAIESDPPPPGPASDAATEAAAMQAEATGRPADTAPQPCAPVPEPAPPGATPPDGTPATPPAEVLAPHADTRIIAPASARPEADPAEPVEPPEPADSVETVRAAAAAAVDLELDLVEAATDRQAASATPASAPAPPAVPSRPSVMPLQALAERGDLRLLPAASAPAGPAAPEPAPSVHAEAVRLAANLAAANRWQLPDD